MKRGQIGIALVILGVIAIIAVIGLVLLFTRASKEAQGALLYDLSIGNPYGSQGGAQGIAPTFPTEQYQRFGGGGYQIRTPVKEVPGYITYPTAVIDTKGTRTPAYIISARFEEGERSGFATIADSYGCEWSLITGAKMGVPHDAFNCYQVPNKGVPQGPAVGYYPPDSSAEPRPIKSDLGNQGGDVYCYANSYGAEAQIPDSEDRVRLNVLNAVKSGKANYGNYEWTTTIVNGKEVPVCWISAKTFPFPQ
ncbi:MAG: hypothetical protein QW165_02025 [Candidatus Woesearchaeota archaeon]